VRSFKPTHNLIMTVKKILFLSTLISCNLFFSNTSFATKRTISNVIEEIANGATVEDELRKGAVYGDSNFAFLNKKECETYNTKCKASEVLFTFVKEEKMNNNSMSNYELFTSSVSVISDRHKIYKDHDLMSNEKKYLINTQTGFTTSDGQYVDTLVFKEYEPR